MFSRPVFAFIFAEWTHDTAQEELESRPIEVIVCANEAHVMIRAWGGQRGGCRSKKGVKMPLQMDVSTVVICWFTCWCLMISKVKVPQVGQNINRQDMQVGQSWEKFAKELVIEHKESLLKLATECGLTCALPSVEININFGRGIDATEWHDSHSRRFMGVPWFSSDHCSFEIVSCKVYNIIREGISAEWIWRWTSTFTFACEVPHST